METVSSRSINVSLPHTFDLLNSTLETTSSLTVEEPLKWDRCRNWQIDSSYNKTNISRNRNDWELFVILYNAKHFIETCIKLFLHVSFGFG